MSNQALKTVAWIGAGVGAAGVLLKILRRPDVKLALGDLFDSVCTRLDQQVGWSRLRRWEDWWSW